MATAVLCMVLAGTWAQHARADDSIGFGGIIRYDAKIGLLEAGAVDMLYEPKGTDYELSGTVSTQGVIERFFRWRGYFASVGAFEDGFPTTSAYFLLEVGDGGRRREVVLAAEGQTVVHSNYEPSKVLDHPEGSDLMSVIFLGPHCIDKPVVHDGEDAYYLDLLDDTSAYIRDREPYYSGDTRRCDYGYSYKGRPRQVTIWVAEYLGRSMPMRIRVRIPLIPDGILRLRLD